MDGLDPVYREAALRAGRMMLNWAGLEDASGTRLNDEPAAEEFLEAVGNSSVPEACGIVGDSIRGLAETCKFCGSLRLVHGRHQDQAVCASCWDMVARRIADLLGI